MQLEELPTSTDLTINHKQASFSAPGHDWDLETRFSAVIIGAVKQRIMWPAFNLPSVQGTQPKRPMCKSNDNRHGHPQANFPWEDFRSGGVTPDMLSGPLSCKACEFRKNPAVMKKDGQPVCESSFKLILLDDADKIVLFTAQGAARRVMDHYIDWFTKNNTPMFTHKADLVLNAVKNNGTRYADLEITKGGRTDRSLWVSRYLPLYKQWRSELEAAPAKFSTGKPDLPVLDM